MANLGIAYSGYSNTPYPMVVYKVYEVQLHKFRSNSCKRINGKLAVLTLEC